MSIPKIYNQTSIIYISCGGIVESVWRLSGYNIFFITLEKGIKKTITEYTLPYPYPKNKKIDLPFFE